MQLWRALDQMTSWSGVRSVWRERLGDEFEFVAPWLMPIEQLAMSLPSGADGVARVVIHGDDDIVVVDPECGEARRIEQDDIVIYRLNDLSLSKAVALALGLDATPSAVGGGGRLWWLGEFEPIAGERFPVYLAVGSAVRDMLMVTGYLSALSRRPFVLVTPTRQGEGEAFHQAIEQCGAAWLVLESIMWWEAPGRFGCKGSLRDLLPAFVVRHVPIAAGIESKPRFATPPEAQWTDVRLRFSDAHTISVSVLGVSRVCSYTDMGMADKRTNKPTQQWDLLYAFAKERGVLSWDSPSATRRNQKRRERLAKDLRQFFGIDSDPFEYVEALKGWRARFMIDLD